MELTTALLQAIETQKQALHDLHCTLCAIPAPSGKEWRRTEFVLNWLHEAGLSAAYADAAGNVICPMGPEDGPATAFLAHLDVVFPDEMPLPLTEADGRIHCPGAGDNSAQAAVLMLTAKLLQQAGICPKKRLLFCWDVGEEGLGNLKGARAFFRSHENQIDEVCILDLSYTEIMDKCVGSRRFKVRIETPGGHSFSDFGTPNAIAVAAELIGKLYAISVPEKPGAHTTYNVGLISGGTSVNTIAQAAELLCEYRSDDGECMEIMEAEFQRLFAAVPRENVRMTVELVGDRPGMGPVDPAKQEALAARCAALCEKHSGIPCSRASGSTDANIPLSMGIPAVCLGLSLGHGEHTREEWVETASLPVGMKIAMELILGYC